MSLRHATRAIALTAFALVAHLGVAESQDRRDEQFYLPGDFNWKFLGNYPEGARLFNAFDYGHAVLYERLYTTDGAETDRALEREYQHLTTDLLIRPPQFGIAEEAVMPQYAKLAWRAKQMFDWAHILHRQIFDIYSDERFTRVQQDSLIERATDYYLSRKEYAFLDVPKSMELMDGQRFSQVFKKTYPKFNGLIWAYHWLQVGLYEPFIMAGTPSETKAAIGSTLNRFWSMLENPPGRLPTVMPMTSAIAPLFSAAHPRAAVIFDNLHMMHDIISDILLNDIVPADRKRHEIYAALDEFQDPSRNVMTMEMWRNMADHMGGLAPMGGPATGEMPARPLAQATSAASHAGHEMPSIGATSDSSAVVAAVATFHARLAAGDSTGALAMLAPDAVVLEAGGLESRHEYHQHHLAADIEFAAAVPSVRIVRQVEVLGDMAWVASTSISTGTFKDRAINSSGAELVVLTRSGDRWLIASIHWSSRARRPS